MTIGLDIEHKKMDMIFLKDNQIVERISKPIFSTKRDCNRVIMEKILSTLHHVCKSKIKSIGLSLPSKIDEEKGIIFDLSNIPYWKGLGIKRILEDEFHTHVGINNDVNCLVLGEKYYGNCKDFKDILGITLGPNFGTSIIMNNKLYIDNKYNFYNAKCLSVPCYECIRTYKKSYQRIVEEFNYILKDIEKNNNQDQHWRECGTLIGQLIAITLCDYNPQIIFLGGTLAKHYLNFCNYIDEYLEKFVHPQVLLNLVTLVSTTEYVKALGATTKETIRWPI